MRYALLLLLLTGCAAKKPTKADIPRIGIPRDCVLGATVDAKACQPISAELAKCNDVIVKFACVKVSK